MKVSQKQLVALLCGLGLVACGTNQNNSQDLDPGPQPGLVEEHHPNAVPEPLTVSLPEGYLGVTAQAVQYKPATVFPQADFNIQATGTIAGPPANTQIKLNLKLLVLATTEQDQSYEGIKPQLDAIGLPYDVVFAANQGLSAEMLEQQAGWGKYNGIVLVSDDLSFSNPVTGNYESALDSYEWALLESYERLYKVRSVEMFAEPSAKNGSTLATQATVPLLVGFATGGQSLFPDMRSDASMKIETFAYTATPGANTQAVMKAPNGKAVLVRHTTSDGREKMTSFAYPGDYSEHTRVWMYDLVRWVSKGVFFGERKFYLSMHIDDWFGNSNIWNPALKRVDANYRLSPSSVFNLVNFQSRLGLQYSVMSAFKFDAYYNGAFYTKNSPAWCLADFLPWGVDGLSAVTKCYKDSFWFTSHTYEHSRIEPSTSYEAIYKELSENIKVATGFDGLGLGRTFDKAGLVTGSHSGLGDYWWWSPPKNNGRSGANPNLIRAAVANGITTLGSDKFADTETCTTTLQDCNFASPKPNWGLYFPGNLPQNDLMLVPRTGTRLTLAATTPEELTSAFNHSFGTALNYDQIIELEANDHYRNDVLGLISNPLFMHQGNARRFARNGVNTCIACDVVESVAKKYAAIYNTPIVNLPISSIRQIMKGRMQSDQAKATGVWNTSTNEVVVKFGNAGITSLVPLTNPWLGQNYGPDRVAQVANNAKVVLR